MPWRAWKPMRPVRLPRRRSSPPRAGGPAGMPASKGWEGGRQDSRPGHQPWPSGRLPRAARRPGSARTRDASAATGRRGPGADGPASSRPRSAGAARSTWALGRGRNRPVAATAGSETTDRRGGQRTRPERSVAAHRERTRAKRPGFPLRFDGGFSYGQWLKISRASPKNAANAISSAVTVRQGTCRRGERNFLCGDPMYTMRRAIINFGTPLVSSRG